MRAHIVKAEWFWTSVQNEGAADEKEYLFEDVSLLKCLIYFSFSIIYFTFSIWNPFYHQLYQLDVIVNKLLLQVQHLQDENANA